MRRQPRLAPVLGGGPLSRFAAFLLMGVALAGCDLPGAHSGDAAVVNDHAIPRAKWDHLVRVLQAHIPVDLNSDAGKAQVREVQTQSLRALIREQLIEDLAQQRHVSVSSADLDAEVARVAGTLGGQKELNKRLDQTGESMDDIRHTLRINLLQSRMKAASSTYQSDFDSALQRARVSAYVTPCDSDHSWPACAGGPR